MFSAKFWPEVTLEDELREAASVCLRLAEDLSYLQGFELLALAYEYEHHADKVAEPTPLHVVR